MPSIVCADRFFLALKKYEKLEKRGLNLFLTSAIIILSVIITVFISKSGVTYERNTLFPSARADLQAASKHHGASDGRNALPMA
jgi:hypothetical protein